MLAFVPAKTLHGCMDHKLYQYAAHLSNGKKCRWRSYSSGAGAAMKRPTRTSYTITEHLNNVLK